jgi:hypothetical protein
VEGGWKAGGRREEAGGAAINSSFDVRCMRRADESKVPVLQKLKAPGEPTSTQQLLQITSNSITK